MNNRVTTSLAVIAAAVLWPASLAAANRSCVAGKPTPASYTWNFRAEASHLLNNIQADADFIKDHSDVLEQTALDGTISWQTDADRLASIRDRVNDMGRKVCRLEQIRRVAAPSQRKAIDRVAVQVRLMADNTEDAINFTRVHEGLFWEPAYRHEVANLYHESSQVERSLKSLDQNPNA